MTSSPSGRSAGRTLDPAWVVLGILLAMLMLNQGDRAFFGNVYKALQAHFGTNRTDIAIVIAVNTVISGFSQPIWGRIFERFGTRAAIAPSSLLVALGFALVPTATEFWQLYLYFGVIAGFGLGGTSASIAFAAAAPWFRLRRAFAFGLLAAGGMAGSFAIVPGSMAIVLAFGWQATFLVIAILSFAVGAPYILGLMPGRPPEAAPVARVAGQPAPAPPVPQLGIVAAARTGTFWLLAIPSWVSGFCGVVVQLHVVPMLTDRGFDPQLSANAMGLVSGVGMLAVIGAGLLAPRYGERHLLASIYLLRAVGVIFLAFTHSLPLLILAVVFVGLSWGGVQPMVGGLTGDAFGRESLASILGWIFMTQNVIGASAAILGGAIFDLTGDYFILIFITGLSLLVGVPMSLMIPRAARPAAVAAAGPGAG